MFKYELHHKYFMNNVRTSQETIKSPLLQTEPTVSPNIPQKQDFYYRKMRCPFCWNNRAYKYINIRNPAEAHWYCDSCDKMIK